VRLPAPRLGSPKEIREGSQDLGSHLSQ